MPYRYLEDLTMADVAFEATGPTPEELFVAAAEATVSVMVEDIGSIRPRVSRAVHLKDSQTDMLLFQYLQELIYFKDAERLLLRSGPLEIRKEEDGELTLIGELQGEPLDPQRHVLLVDVKAVTLHRFRVEHDEQGWRATVILDI